MKTIRIYVQTPAISLISPENDNKTNVVIEKKKRGTKHDYWISPEDAARFEYEDLMLISRLKAKLNDLRDTNKSKRVTSKSILEYLINEGYMSEKYVDGVWVKIISEKGQSQGIRYIKCKNKLGFEYVIIGIPRQIQRMVVEYFTRI